MGAEGTQNSPVVENTPAVNTQETGQIVQTPSESQQSTQVNQNTPAGNPDAANELKALLDAKFAELEQRLGQSAKDSAIAAVNKALGVHKKQTAQSNATQQTKQTPAPVQQVQQTQVQQTTTPVTTNTTTTVQNVPEITADPELVKAYELLQKDGVNVEEGVDEGILEAYRIQVRAGIHLTGADPEINEIDGSSLASYIITTTAAVNKAKARLIEEGKLVEDSKVVDPALAMATGLVSGNPVSRQPFENMSGSRTLEYAFKHPERR